MMKLHEDAGTLVLQFNALTGSVSTFVIDKEKGQFARIGAGNVLGVYSFAALGRCE